MSLDILNSKEIDVQCRLLSSIATQAEQFVCSENGTMNTDPSNNFIFTKVRAVPADISNSFVFNSFTTQGNATKEITTINEINTVGITEPFGILKTDIVICSGLRLVDFSNNSPTHGSATLVGGTINVDTKAMNANALVFVMPKTANANSGLLRVSHKSSIAFTITSTNASDTATFDWIIFNPVFSP
jgi:hypothetical protein